MKVINTKIEKLIPYARNPRNNQRAVDKVASSIKEFGFRQPIVVDPEYVVVAGHTRLLASQKLGLSEVPVHVAENLTEQQIKAFRLADNHRRRIRMGSRTSEIGIRGNFASQHHRL